MLLSWGLLPDWAIVGEDDQVAWLVPHTRAVELTTLLRPYPADRMEAFPVSRYVSKAGNEGPRCIEPLAEAAA